MNCRRGAFTKIVKTTPCTVKSPASLDYYNTVFADDDGSVRGNGFSPSSSLRTQGPIATSGYG